MDLLAVAYYACLLLIFTILYFVPPNLFVYLFIYFALAPYGLPPWNTYFSLVFSENPQLVHNLSPNFYFGSSKSLSHFNPELLNYVPFSMDDTNIFTVAFLWDPNYIKQ